MSFSIKTDSFATPLIPPSLGFPWVPLSMGFLRQEYWSGPFPSPGDLPDPGIELESPALQADSLPSEPPGKLRLLRDSERQTSTS